MHVLERDVGSVVVVLAVLPDDVLRHWESPKVSIVIARVVTSVALGDSSSPGHEHASSARVAPQRNAQRLIPHRTEITATASSPKNTSHMMSAFPDALNA